MPSSSSSHEPLTQAAVASSQKTISTNPFDDTPIEIVLTVADFLEPWDLNSLIQTSHFFANLLDSHLYALALTYRFSDKAWGYTSVIEWATIYGQPTVLRKLIQAGADIGVTDHAGWGLLHNAAEFRHGTLVQMLLDAGIDPAARTLDGGTALNLAVSQGDEAVTRSILAAGADVSSASKDLQTPLHLAAEKGFLPLVELLLEAGGDPSAVDCYGMTPLLWAVQEGFFPIVKVLLPLTRDLEVKDGVSGNALHLALRKGQRDVIELLLSVGVDPLQLDGYGLSCMDRASVREDIFELLKPYCREQYHAADETMTSTATRKTIVNLAQAMHDKLLSVHDPRAIELARCLIFENDVSEARTAIAFGTAARFNGEWACEICKNYRPTMCGICDKKIDGDGYLCRRCPDSDLCSSCYASSQGPPEVGLCRGHEFVCIPLPPPETSVLEEEDIVNSLGESRVQWLARLVDSYSPTQNDSVPT